MPSGLAVSLTASREYRDALNAVARRRGVRVGVLVKEALDECYGDEIDYVMELFFVPRDQDATHSDGNLIARHLPDGSDKVE